MGPGFSLTRFSMFGGLPILFAHRPDVPSLFRRRLERDRAAPVRAQWSPGLADAEPTGRIVEKLVAGS